MASQNSYFVPGFGISRAVIQNEIRYYCGPDSIVRPYTYQNRDGYRVTTTGPPLTKAQVEDLKISSSEYEEKQRLSRSREANAFVNQPIHIGDRTESGTVSNGNERTAQDAALDEGFVFVEKRRVDIDALADEIAASPHTAHGRDMRHSNTEQHKGANGRERLHVSRKPTKIDDDQESRYSRKIQESNKIQDLMIQRLEHEAARRQQKEAGKQRKAEEERRRSVELKPQAPSSPWLSRDSTMTWTTSVVSIHEGAHLELESKDVLPYELIRNLGHGASASVEMVKDVTTGSVFARKIFRNVYSRNLNTVKRQFQNELHVMRRLASHHHIVRVFATYVAQRELALILSPVADGGDLAAFLQEFRDAGFSSPTFRKDCLVLQRAIGCLASGLAFMHKQTVRHKDIKPQNILIHGGNVIYTDFGISLDFAQQDSTTIGHPQSFTKRYCAPEVADFGSRNSRSDVFSLGCVYVEILAALHPPSVPEDLLEGPFHENLHKLQTSNWHPAEAPYTVTVIGGQYPSARLAMYIQASGVSVTKCEGPFEGTTFFKINFKSKGEAVKAITTLSRPGHIQHAYSDPSSNYIPSERSDPDVELFLPGVIRRMLNEKREERPSAQGVVELLFSQSVFYPQTKFFCERCQYLQEEYQLGMIP
ncbi:kinase-like protein [Lophiostoma macrostomum CBS 122681]|uniref:mitogen-activated protein kinase kinase n=1 Tax=Lophiostoma macrostomum CBS 122681 TaxID=1314788 RepID=A0A6A6TDR2_9PLEO|nr:kinase-like protein [Lophiostoma macrostomum CBS 122681]